MTSLVDVAIYLAALPLLDNAIEACSRFPENQETENSPFLRVYIGMKGSQLYICITNTVYGRAKQEGGRFVTGKKSGGHGLGLMRIDRICQKYDGYIRRGSEEGAFSTEILLPVGE